MSSRSSPVCGASGGSIDGFSSQLRIRHKNGAYRWIDLGCVSAFDNPFIRVWCERPDLTDRQLTEARPRDGDDVFRLRRSGERNRLRMDLILAGAADSAG